MSAGLSYDEYSLGVWASWLQDRVTGQKMLIVMRMLMVMISVMVMNRVMVMLVVMMVMITSCAPE